MNVSLGKDVNYLLFLNISGDFFLYSLSRLGISPSGRAPAWHVRPWVQFPGPQKEVTSFPFHFLLSHRTLCSEGIRDPIRYVCLTARRKDLGFPGTVHTGMGHNPQPELPVSESQEALHMCSFTSCHTCAACQLPSPVQDNRLRTEMEGKYS